MCVRARACVCVCVCVGVCSIWWAVYIVHVCVGVVVLVIFQ